MNICKYFSEKKKYLRSISIFLTLICIFSSCFSQKQSTVAGKSNSLVAKDIPHDTKGNPMRFYQKKIEMEKMIGLEPLELGFDSIQIRMWYGIALRDKLQLLVLKKKDSKWFAQFYYLELNYDNNRDSLLSVTKKIETKKPISGWEYFIKKLFKMGILTFPDSQAIKDYGDCDDGDGITVETSTIKNYRIYNYPCFSNQDRIDQAKKMELIMELIEKEFSFRRLTAK